MLSARITHACLHFPNNHTERFLLYPALIVYSPVENLVKTSVGCIFTALSLISLGLYPQIIEAANWTRYSRGILSVPSQIFGNIFGLHSKILTEYNINRPNICAIAQAMQFDVQTDNGMPSLRLKVREDFNNENSDYLSDIGLAKAQKVCTKLFYTRTESKIKLVAQHILFRVFSLINGIACFGLLGIIAPMTSIIFIPFSIYHRGKEEKYNDLAFMIFKIPVLIHSVALTLRMSFNPLQFVQKSSKEPELDTSPIINALDAPGAFWKNALELSL